MIKTEIQKKIENTGLKIDTTILPKDLWMKDELFHCILSINDDMPQSLFNTLPKMIEHAFDEVYLVYVRPNVSDSDVSELVDWLENNKKFWKTGDEQFHD